MSRWRPGEFIFPPVVQMEVQVVSHTQNLQRKDDQNGNPITMDSITILIVRFLCVMVLSVLSVLRSYGKPQRINIFD